MRYSIGVIMIIIFLFLSSFVYAKNIDLNKDDCVDDNDLDILIANYASEDYGTFDLDEDGKIDINDHRIINSYKKKGSSKGVYVCNGFECYDEICNGEDDDCDLIVDEGCEEPEETYCEKTDEKDVYVKGSIESDYFQGDDFCFLRKDLDNEKEETHNCKGENCFLVEYDCNNVNEVEEFLYECEYGCWEGACINPECEILDEIEVDFSEDLCGFAIDECGLSYEWMDTRCCGDDSNEFIRCDETGECICCFNPEDEYVNGKCGFVEEENEEQSITKKYNADVPLIIGAALLLFVVVFLAFMGKPKNIVAKKKSSGGSKSNIIKEKKDKK
jgi:hypothetical protein